MDPSCTAIFEEIQTMFPEMDPDTLLSVLFTFNWDPSAAIEVLLKLQNPEKGPESQVQLQEDFLEIEEPALVQHESVPGDMADEFNYQQQLQRILEESIQQREPQAKKPSLGKRFKEKLKSLFKKKKKLEEAKIVEEDPEDLDAEVIIFRVP